MNFVTPGFLLFFMFALVLCRMTRTDTRRHTWALIGCNLVFYSFAGIRALAVLLAVSVLAWAGGALLSKQLPHFIKKTFMVLIASLFVSIIGFFKYYGFFLTNIDALLKFSGHMGLPSGLFEADIVYVAGISFFLFQAISYTADVYSGKTKAFPLPDVVAYISYFPTIMSGPIMRPSDFFPQKNSRKEPENAAGEAVILILSGLFKKVVLSSYLSEHIVRDVFAAPGDYTSLAVLIGVYGYAMQLYCDFSGYSDLAMAVGRLMGYRLPENFNSPYLAASPQELWHRWHISLSSWLRDYVYFTAGGSRTGNVYFNLWLTMAVGGLWHGSDWTFLIWGCAHGLLLAAHRIYARHIKPRFMTPRKIKKPPLAYTALCIFLTFHMTAALWIPFRADDLSSAGAVFAQLFAFSGAGEGFPWFAPVVIALSMAVQIVGPVAFKVSRWGIRRLPGLLQGVILAAGAALLMEMGPDGVLPFIYFGF